MNLYDCLRTIEKGLSVNPSCFNLETFDYEHMFLGMWVRNNCGLWKEGGFEISDDLQSLYDKGWTLDITENKGAIDHWDMICRIVDHNSKIAKTDPASGFNIPELDENNPTKTLISLFKTKMADDTAYSLLYLYFLWKNNRLPVANHLSAIKDIVEKKD